MTSLFLTLMRFVRGVRGAWSIPDFRSVLLLVAMTLASGTVFFHGVEGWSWVDAFYFSVTTMSTVGYCNLAPKTDFGKLFTALYIIVAVGLRRPRQLPCGRHAVGSTTQKAAIVHRAG